MAWIFVALLLIKMASASVIPKYKLVVQDYSKESESVFGIDKMKRNYAAPRSLIRNAVTDPSRKWPNGIVPYVINSAYTEEEKSIIRTAMGEIEHDVNTVGSECIKFVEKKLSDHNYVEIFKGDDCSANIGLQNTGRQESSITSACVVKGIVMHEMLHVLGFYHEQTRSDRDDYIIVDHANVAIEGNFRKLAPEMQNTLNTPYDYTSIMHYGPYFLAVDRSKPVITPKEGMASGVMIGQRRALSDLDALRVQRLYGCQEDITHISHDDAEHITSCNFETDICNMKEETSGTWKIMRGPSTKGPKADHTNGADGYLIAEEGSNTGTVKISTPLVPVEAACIDFFFYQKGPTSYLSLEVYGPLIGGTIVLGRFGGGKYNADRWQHIRTPVNAGGFDIKITLVAEIIEGDVAIDDVNIFKGSCV